MANRNGNHFWNQLLQSAEPVASAVMTVAGAALGAASAALQISVFSGLIGGGWISTTIVLAFEATKASTAVVQTSGRHRGKTRMLRVGLFLLSFIATLFYVSAQLTAPNLEEVTNEEIESVNKHFSERIEAVRDRYAPQIARYHSLKRAERNDTYADGTYTGPQFQEFRRLKKELIAERDAKVQDLQNQREAAIREIRKNPPSDRRVQNEKVASLIRLARNAFGIEIKNAWVALFVASMVALLMELAIFKLFAEIGELSRKARKKKAARRRRRETPSPAGPASGEPAGAAGTGATTAGAASGKAGIDTPGGHEAEEDREAEDREAKASSPGSKKARRNGKADRSSSGGSSTLYSWMGVLSLAPALALLVFLEGGTPVAPMQRVVGNTLNALPPAGLRLVMGEEDARRYMHPERHIAAQEQQGVLGGGGVMLARPTANPEFPKTLRRTLVQTENHRFWDRYAVDWWSTGRATVATAKAKIFGGSGGGLEGGSGLTQQLAGSVVLKNSELMSAGLLPGIAGKLWEAAVSSGMIDRLSREKVLNLYLRGVYLGRGSDGPIKGFAEAAWTYFHRPVDELTDAQIVALVSILPSPNGFVANDDRFERRYEAVVGWLRKRNVFTPAESEALLQNRPALRVQVDEQYQRVHDATTHARDYLLGERVADSLGTVRSTISASASVGARRIFMDMIRDLENRTGNGRLEGFVLVAEQGKLRAMIGSTSLTGYNRTVEEFAPWSPGSTMKPYTYAEFFGAQGGSLTDRLPVQPRTFDLPGGGTWHPENYSRRYDDHEPMAAGRALANSINVAAASLTVGPVGESLRRRLAGVGYGDFAGHPSDVLGSRGVRPLRHFRLLQAFTPPYGDIPEEGFALRRTEEVNRRGVWPQAAARKTARALGLAVTEGTLSGGRRCCGWSARTHRGKTGTGQDDKAATLYVSRSGGVTVLMGVYSLGGARLTYQGRAGSVAGGSLIPYADRILQLSALRQTRGGSFDAIADL